MAAFYFLGGAQYLQPATYQALYADNPGRTLAVFFLVYVAVTALSIPGAAILTMIAGAVFGLWTGVALVSFASSIGATLAFLSSRLVLRDWVQSRFAGQLEKLNRGIEKDGVFYLFSLRLIPAVPFFVINLVMGLTPIRTVAFYLASQLGMLPGTFVFVNAGAEIGKIDSLSLDGILRPGIVLAFLLLAAMPYLVRAIRDFFVRRRVYADWAEHKPPRFDANVVVIGAGSGGPGCLVDRRGRQSQGDSDRESGDGRRLPEHRLRAQQGTDPCGQSTS